MREPQVALEGVELAQCRGMQGACRFALVRDSSFAQRIGVALRASAAWEYLGRGNGEVLPHHKRLRVALAACPNACTMPQIRDIGIIVTARPRASASECDGCGCCEQVCREEAIMIRAGQANWDKDRCLGCGQCVDRCPNHALESGQLRGRVLIGGKMGRHPRWAEELCEVELTAIPEVVKVLLDRIAQEVQAIPSVARAVEKIGMQRLRQECSLAVGLPEWAVSHEAGATTPGVSGDRYGAIVRKGISSPPCADTAFALPTQPGTVPNYDLGEMRIHIRRVTKGHTHDQGERLVIPKIDNTRTVERSYCERPF